MKLVRVNPVHSFNAVDHLLNDFFNAEIQSDRYAEKELLWQPAVNLFEDEKSVGVELLIPGFENDQVKISIEKNLLVVKSEVDNQEKPEFQYSRIEFKPQNIEKRFKLSEKLDPDKVEAVFRNGILKIVISKKEEIVSQRREIEIV